MSPQSPNNQTDQTQDANEAPVTFAVTIGELNAIFGTINASAFRAVMQPIVTQLSHQVQAHQLPPQQTQAEVQSMTVNLTLKAGELNSILNIINSSGFVAIMKPTTDRIIGQVQLSQQQAAPQSQMPFSMIAPPEAQ